MELIKMEWRYQNKTYYTTAIASNDQGGIIYDPIGSAFVEIITLKKPTKSLLKSRSEKPAGPPTSQSFYKADEGRGMIFGSLLWSYKISCTSYFTGLGKLDDSSLSGEGEAPDILWSCSASAKTVAGFPGDSYHTFAWGYAFGFAGTVSFSFNGAGFSASGSGGSGTGEETHTP